MNSSEEPNSKRQSKRKTKKKRKSVLKKRKETKGYAFVISSRRRWSRNRTKSLILNDYLGMMCKGNKLYSLYG
jgi:hypothetical protein